MRLTVFGATGGIGRQIVTQALDRGHHVTAVVRDRTRFRGPETRLEVLEVPGLRDPRPLEPTVLGRDAVLSGVGPRGRSDGPVAAPATAAITQAMLATGRRRLIVVSALPVGPVPPDEGLLDRWVLLPLISRVLAPVYRDLGQMEHQLAETDLNWTVVRPPRLVDRPLTASYRSAIGSNVPRSRLVSRADVAHLMLELLDNPASTRQPVGIAAGARAVP